MELLNTDISTLSYKIIKEKVDKLIIKDILKDDSLNILIKKLELDSRKMFKV